MGLLAAVALCDAISDLYYCEGGGGEGLLWCLEVWSRYVYSFLSLLVFLLVH